MVGVSPMTIAPLQTSLQKLGLYLGRIDDTPGPLTADALVCALASHPPPMAGSSLFKAIPLDWWDAPRRIAMLYAQINAETGFMLKAENLNYDAAGLRKTWPTRFDPAHGGQGDATVYAHHPEAIANLVYSGRNGNKTPTDGWAFRGRSWAQITGRAEYFDLGGAIHIDLLANPEKANDVFVAGQLAVAYATRREGFLAAADAGNVDVCRHLWNGGSVGLQTAVDSFDKVMLLWGQP